MSDANEVKTQNFFYLEQEEKLGPFTGDDLLDLYEAGKINENTQIMEEKENKWMKVSQNKKLHDYFRTMLNEEEYEEEPEDFQQDEVSSLIQELDDLNNQKENEEKEEEEEVPTVSEEKIENPLKRKEPPSNIPQLPPNVSKDTIIEYNEQTGRYFYKESDGLILEFDSEKTAWFPKLDSSFMEKQSEIYGPTIVTSTDEKPKKKKKEKVDKEKVSWNEQGNQTNLYVTGLPKDITLKEFKDYFSHFGVFKKDLETGEDRAKLYYNEKGEIKGDGVVYFMKEESVQNALNLLDNTEIKPGYPIKLSIATFKKKENFQPKEKKFNKKDYQKQFKQLEWGIEKGRIEETKGPKIVILKYMFTLDQFSTDPLFEQNLKFEIRDECQRFGQVEKIKVFKNNPDGVVEVKFVLSSSAELCIKDFNGRFFDGRKISAEIWDYKTKYNEVVKQQDEDDEDEDELRWEEFGKKLDQQ